MSLDGAAAGSSPGQAVMSRNYYVIHEDDEWKVKLEQGRVVSANHRTMKGAKRKAKRLARRNNRGVTVNAKAGYTRYHIDKEEL
jgi:hypothetical protein